MFINSLMQILSANKWLGKVITVTEQKEIIQEEKCPRTIFRQKINIMLINRITRCIVYGSINKKSLLYVYQKIPQLPTLLFLKNRVLGLSTQ